MENELVSIITPSYNSAEFVVETIESILAQTYSNWELLITDDCSTDNSVEIIQGYVKRDSRIKLFQLAKNGGAGVCRNRSLKEARGRYIAFCDSDDCWLPTKLEKQLNFIKKKQCALTYSSYLKCDVNSNPLGIVVAKKKETFFSMQCNDGIGFLTFLYDRKKVGDRLMPELRKRQDWGFKLDIFKDVKVGYGLKEPLGIYRIRPNSISRKKSSLIKFNIKVYETVLGYSEVTSILFFSLLFMPKYTFNKIFQRLINR